MVNSRVLGLILKGQCKSRPLYNQLWVNKVMGGTRFTKCAQASKVRTIQTVLTISWLKPQNHNCHVLCHGISNSVEGNWFPRFQMTTEVQIDWAKRVMVPQSQAKSVRSLSNKLDSFLNYTRCCFWNSKPLFAMCEVAWLFVQAKVLTIVMEARLKNDPFFEIYWYHLFFYWVDGTILGCVSCFSNLLHYWRSITLIIYVQ